MNWRALPSIVPYLNRAFEGVLYGVLCEPREASNILTVTDSNGTKVYYLNFENKERYLKFKKILKSLPSNEGEYITFGKTEIAERRITKEENSHRENCVRYWLPSFEGESQFVTLKVSSLRQAKKIAANLLEVMPYVSSIELTKETLNGEKITFGNDTSKVYVYCTLKDRKFASVRYSIATVRNDEGRIKCIFKRKK